MGWRKKETGEELEVPAPAAQPQPKPQEPERLWNVGVVATETAPVIVNSKTGQQFDLYSAIALLLERTED